MKWYEDVARATLILAAGCTFTGTTPFADAVKATTDQLPVLERSSDFCRMGLPLNTDIDPKECEQDADVAQLPRAMKTVQAYATALTKLSDVKAIDSGDAVDALIKLGEAAAGDELDDADKGALKKAIDILTKAFTTLYKRKHIRQNLWSTDSSVQCVAYRGVAAVGVWKRTIARQLSEVQDQALALTALDRETGKALEDLRALNIALGNDSEALRTAKTALLKFGEALRAPPDAKRLQFGLMALQLNDQTRQLDVIERGLKSLAVAHNMAACRRDEIGTTTDAALKKDIGAAIECITNEKKGKEATCAAVLSLQKHNREHACIGLEGLDPKQPAPAPRCTDK